MNLNSAVIPLVKYDPLKSMDFGYLSVWQN